jgi:phosphoenolpyruvate carboxylase
MIRHPYVRTDPVNVIQAEFLKRLRAMEKKSNLSPEQIMEELDVWKDAIVLSINGVASGMRNSE